MDIYMASLVAQIVKNLPAVQETWLLSLGRKDPLEKEIATHSSILFFFLMYLFELEANYFTILYWFCHIST